MAVKSEVKCGVARRKSSQTVTFCMKEERNASYKKVSSILQKAESDRTDEEKEVLFTCSELVKEVTRRIEKRKKVKERLQEIEDPPDLLAEKCYKLAEAVTNSTNLVVYTGAGVSTAACIPDYRGTNGIWTLLQQGKDIGLHDLTQAEPTLTHMALWQLYNVGKLKHVVSQNCDGLHLRSGLPKGVLSEVHGNMYIEVCCKCKPSREYWRLFDVTEHTARFSHRTMRRCYTCMGPLIDTIVHFGERGKLQWPLNWSKACQAADKADVILCIGSSLKVLKKYPWLWGMDKPAKKRPKLYIVNLQWTPKDDQAILKISGKCDEVMRQVMSYLNLEIPNYIRNRDPIFSHTTDLDPAELHTATHPLLKQPPNFTQGTCPSCNSGEVKTCHCSREEMPLQNCTVMKNKDAEVSGNYSYISDSSKVEVGVCKKEDSQSQETQMLNNNEKHINTVGSFHFVNINTDNTLNSREDYILDFTLDRNIEDPLGKLEEPSLRNELIDIDKTEVVLVEEGWFENQSPKINLSVGSENGHHLNSSCSDGVTNIVGLKMDLTTSFDPILNSDQGICDQNSLHIKDIIVECSSSTNGEQYSRLIGSHSHSSSSINNMGCDSGTSSSKGTTCVLNINANNDSILLPVFDFSSLSYHSPTRILEVEHNYSKIRGSHVLSKENSIYEHKSKTKSIKESTLPPEKESDGRHCKRLKTNRTNLQSTTFSQPFKSASPQSTKEPTGKQETKDEKKQICDDKYDIGDTIMCSFCKSNYSSNSCLFYPRWTSKFETIPLGSQVSICECCDTDEDTDTDEVCKKEGDDTHDNSEGVEAADTSKVTKVPNINPGWYGKGYRKRTKKKRFEKL